MNEKLFVLNSQKRITNHILHLILTIFTGGLWIIIWIGVAARNSSKNKKIEKAMHHILYYKEQGATDVETYRLVNDDNARARKNTVSAVIACVVAIILYFLVNRYM